MTHGTAGSLEYSRIIALESSPEIVGVFGGLGSSVNGFTIDQSIESKDSTNLVSIVNRLYNQLAQSTRDPVVESSKAFWRPFYTPN